jgi:hypothetical protein
MKLIYAGAPQKCAGFFLNIFQNDGFWNFSFAIAKLNPFNSAR